MAKKPRQVIAFRLDPDQIVKLQELWERDGISPSESVRRAVASWLELKGMTKKTARRGSGVNAPRKA